MSTTAKSGATKPSASVTVGSRGFGTHAAGVSKRLINMGFNKYSSQDSTRGGFDCAEWGKDSDGGVAVKITIRHPERGLKGIPSEHTINRLRREELARIWVALRSVNLQVRWGWDPKTDEPDTTFIVASLALAGPGSPLPAPSSNGQAQAAPAPVQPPSSAAPANLLITIDQIDQVVVDIAMSHNGGKGEQARRLEHDMYQKALLAIVMGDEDPRLLAAAALATQHLGIPR